MEFIKTKVCVVGSGIAGCLCAKFLSKSVNDILIVERGSRVTHASRLLTGQQEEPSPTAEHHHIVKGQLATKNIQYIYAMGGTTNVWVGHTPRLIPNDFRMKSLYGVMEDWPLNYEDLEPYYCLVEEEMGIAGGNDNPRVPRSRPLPLPPHPFSPADQLAKQCFPEGDVVSLPQARPTVSIGNRPACCGSATCMLCPIDSKYTPMNSHIPELEKNSSIRFLSETAVVSLVSDKTGKINRALAITKDGSEITIEAEMFVLAANAVENAAILLRSSSVKQHSDTGTNLFDHPVFALNAKIDRDGFPNYGNSISTAICYSFADGPFRNQRASALALVKNYHPINEFVTDMAMDNDLHGRNLHKRVLEQFRNRLGLTFMMEDRPAPGNFIKIGRNPNRIGIPQTEIYYNNYSSYVQRTHQYIIQEASKIFAPLGISGIKTTNVYFAGHLLGTCKMGEGNNGVVDRDLRYRQYDNLYILGGSAFPTYSAANPTLTIAALAIRLGFHLSGTTPPA